MDSQPDSPTALKYCENCRWFSIDNGHEKRFGHCLRPAARPSGIDNHYRFVAPEYEPPPPYASCERASGVKGDCGPGAQFFEPRAAVGVAA